MAESEKIFAEFNVYGHVQGVGYRFFVYRKARELYLTGYAKNMFDGSVNVIAEGLRENIESLHAELKQGPSRSRVEKILVRYEKFTGNFNDFRIA